jgi:hypothetical protein
MDQNNTINDCGNGQTEVSVAVNDERNLGMPLFHSGRFSALLFDSDQSSCDGEFFLLAIPDLGANEIRTKITKSEDTITIFAAFINPGNN